jgi:phospholipid/cholesterol/gamma-HCH transport system substrate-binding protein
MSRKANPTLIGAFVLGGVLLAVAAVVVFGSGRLFRDTRSFISFFDGSVAGLEVGAPVKFRGIDVGEVSDILLDVPGVQRELGDVRIAVVYELDRKQLEARGATVRLSDPFNIDTLRALGIRAELSTESLVTGRKFIALDLDPANPVQSQSVRGTPYPEIPAVNTGLDRIQEQLQGIIKDLGTVRLDELVNVATQALGQIGTVASSPELASAIKSLPGAVQNLNTTVGKLQTLMSSVDSSLVPMRDGILATAQQTTTTMQRMESTMKSVGATLQPESPASVRFEQAMTELSAASRALRALADYLQQNPSALVRGKSGGDR